MYFRFIRCLDESWALVGNVRQYIYLSFGLELICIIYLIDYYIGVIVVFALAFISSLHYFVTEIMTNNNNDMGIYIKSPHTFSEASSYLLVYVIIYSGRYLVLTRQWMTR